MSGVCYTCSLLFLLALLGQCLGFLSTQESGKPGDYTHQSITEKGIYEAAAVFIRHYIKKGANGGSDPTRSAFNITEDFFKGDPSSEAAFGNVVETIVMGNLLLESIREQILTLANSPKYEQNEVRRLIGTYLFSMQMFYSNTNWVEMRGNVSSKELGIRGKSLMTVAPPNEATCTNCLVNVTLDDPSSCQDNVLVNDKYLTSGYNGIQGIPKPKTDNSTAVNGKCSHGGKNDPYRSVPATGGINKETSDPLMSPHYFLHQAAGQAAVEATALFLTGEVSGLLDQLGPRKFGEILGLPVDCKDCLQTSLSLAYVIDTSLSMSEDLNQIKTKVRDTILSTMADPKKSPKHFVLTTFSDPLSLNTLMQTNDSREMLTWFQNLTQEGGGDCPEYAFHALLDGNEQKQKKKSAYLIGLFTGVGVSLVFVSLLLRAKQKRRE
ncbi:hypothetical protein FSP39_009795 [Pinctada imbricata]|uniref:Uncharacterized protein n=1 Tax=Pinctada imbricata TaxID=66713 RepID=A0AA88XIH2_PINIB|nr:hypothetical protein FSP39_009795 [Pinctada imbricata]